MKKVYKLTDEYHTTHGNTQWGPNVRHTTNGEGDLCGPGWLHYYDSPEVAVFMNPAHAKFEDYVLWEADARGKFKDDHGVKGGCTDLTTVRVVEAPVITRAQRIRTAIYCVNRTTGCDNAEWNAWAGRWLSGEDRSYKAARAAYAAYWAATAARVAADNADNAATAATTAAANDAYSTTTAATAYAAYYAAIAARAAINARVAAANATATYAANAAATAAYAYAATGASKHVKDLDLRSVILKAMRDEDEFQTIT